MSSGTSAGVETGVASPDEEAASLTSESFKSISASIGGAGAGVEMAGDGRRLACTAEKEPGTGD